MHSNIPQKLPRDEISERSELSLKSRHVGMKRHVQQTLIRVCGNVFTQILIRSAEFEIRKRVHEVPVCSIILIGDSGASQKIYGERGNNNKLVKELQ